MPQFADGERVIVVLPRLDPTLGGQLGLFELERAGFEAELGGPVAFSSPRPGWRSWRTRTRRRRQRSAAAASLLPGWLLTVSTALTYDRSGRCIEGAGLPVDVHVPASESQADTVLEAAGPL